MKNLTFCHECRRKQPVQDSAEFFFFCDRGGRKTLDLAAAFFTTCGATRGALSCGKLPGSAKSHLRGTVLRALLGK